MPSGWVHAVIDFLVFGRSYFDMHKEKDKAHETLGPMHRIRDHPWYQEFGNSWSLADPFPQWLREFMRQRRELEGDETAERQQACVVHDYLDRIWDDLGDAEREYWEGFFAWVLFQPDVLRAKFGVDVLKGRIQRVIDGEEIWEECPLLTAEYERLRTYVGAVKRNSETLRNVVDRYG
ncbi:MAG: hypothetical protein IH851_02995 [Armatimonadetes bacterium]|nr:hypothetical protein [Armatimonadota bacterium]